MMNLYEFYQSKKTYASEAIAADRELAKHIQTILIAHGLLSPPADGKWGRISGAALVEFEVLTGLKGDGVLDKTTSEKLIETKLNSLPKPIISLGDNMASNIVKYCQSKNYHLSTRARELNIIYVEGVNADGKPNNDAPNEFNDVRLVLKFESGKPTIIDKWEGTTEPGTYYTRTRPMNPRGAARIAFGWYKAWRVGRHGNSEPHEALVQVGTVKVHRDRNKDYSRAGDVIEEGLYGINQHWGYDLPVRNIGMASAGCLVGRTRAGHREFMGIIKEDWRYKANPKYVFETIVIPGNELKA